MDNESPMTDTMSPAQRHYCMSHIHSNGTKPEVLVRRWLWNHGYRYRLNVKSVPGKPDIVMRRYRTAIFVNGCFWHGHNLAEVQNGSGELASSKCCRLPKANRDFWTAKIKRNIERDHRNYQTLKENGWQVIVVWECQLTPACIERTMYELELLLNEELLSLYRSPNIIPYSTEKETSYNSLAAEKTTV